MTTSNLQVLVLIILGPNICSIYMRLTIKKINGNVTEYCSILIVSLWCNHRSPRITMIQIEILVFEKTLQCNEVSQRKIHTQALIQIKWEVCRKNVKRTVDDNENYHSPIGAHCNFLFVLQETCKRLLHFTVPRVVAVSPQMRLVEDNASSISLLDIYKQVRETW